MSIGETYRANGLVRQSPPLRCDAPGATISLRNGTAEAPSKHEQFAAGAAGQKEIR